jgi:hypothetical protein
MRATAPLMVLYLEIRLHYYSIYYILLINGIVDNRRYVATNETTVVVKELTSLIHRLSECIIDLERVRENIERLNWGDFDGEFLSPDHHSIDSTCLSIYFAQDKAPCFATHTSPPRGKGSLRDFARGKASCFANYKSPP